MAWLPCRYLEADVELTEEREAHIAASHPDLLPEHRAEVAEVVLDPEQVRRSKRFGEARLLSRWYPEVRDGKHIVVVVLSSAETSRHWVITAYITRRLAQGEVEWTRS